MSNQASIAVNPALTAPIPRRSSSPSTKRSEEDWQRYLEEEYGDVAPQGAAVAATDAAIASLTRRFFQFRHRLFRFLYFAFFLGISLGIFSILLGFSDQIDRIFQFIQMNQFASYLLGAILFALYYISMEATFGRTVGKLVTGTRVVTESGARPGLKAVVIRSFSRLIPFEPLSVCWGDDCGRTVGWHDQFSRTRVVKISK